VLIKNGNSSLLASFNLAMDFFAVIRLNNAFNGLNMPSNIDVIDYANELLESFQYNQFTLSRCEPYYRNGYFVFPDALDYDNLQLRTGECSQLAIKFAKLLAKANSYIRGDIKVVIGNEPKYFNGDNKQHLFVTLTDAQRRRWIIDPSLSVIGRSENLDYSEKGQIDFKGIYNRDLTIASREAKPFSMTDSQLMVYIMMTMQVKGQSYGVNLQIGVQRAYDEDIHWKHISDPELTVTIGDNDCLAQIASFHARIKDSFPLISN